MYITFKKTKTKLRRKKITKEKCYYRYTCSIYGFAHKIGKRGRGQIALLEDVFISFYPVLIYCGLVSAKAIIYVTLEHFFSKLFLSPVPSVYIYIIYTSGPTNVFIMSFKYTMLYFRFYFPFSLSVLFFLFNFLCLQGHIFEFTELRFDINVQYAPPSEKYMLRDTF